MHAQRLQRLTDMENQTRRDGNNNNNNNSNLLPAALDELFAAEDSRIKTLVVSERVCD